jgi:hypothetical protein
MPQTLIRIGTVLEPSTAAAGPLTVLLWSIVLAEANPLVSGCRRGNDEDGPSGVLVPAG